MNVSFTAKELADYFGVSRTTAQSDIEDLKEAGYKLEGRPGNAGGYVLRESLNAAGHLLDPVQIELWNSAFDKCSSSEKVVLEYVLHIAETRKNNKKD